MPRDRDIESERHRDTQKHINTETEREGWGTEGDSKAGRCPKTQRLKETPETQNTGRKGRGERLGVQGIRRQGETNRGREMPETHRNM